jgi:hypothetical protein
MAGTSRQGLITELLDRTELVKASSQLFFRLTDDQLHHKPGPEIWSIAEIFGHLNLFHDRYIRSILPRITLAPDYPSDRYASGWLGEWIYEKVKPRADGTVFKIRTLDDYDARGGTPDARDVLDGFQRKCDALDDILRHAATKDLRRIKVPFYLGRLVRLRLGDTLRIMVAHSERHLLQAQRVMAAVT